MKKHRVVAVMAGLACVAALGIGWAAWGPGNTASAQGGDTAKYTPDQVKVTDEWAYSLALQAANWGSPIVIMYALRNNDAVGPNPKAAPNSIWRMENVSTPKLAQEAGYVLPNMNTLYGFGFLDLGPEPIVMSMPDSKGRYYLVECVDMWTNDFAYPAGKQAGYNGGTVAFVGPGWKGKLPTEVKRIDSPTRWMLIQPRVHLYDQSDLPNAQTMLKAITVKGLAEYLGLPPVKSPTYNYAVPKVINRELPVSAMDYEDPLQFWEILSAAMNENPPPAEQVKGLLPLFEPLGLEFGKQWDRSMVHPVVLAAMKRAAQRIPNILYKMPFGAFVNGWTLPPTKLGASGTDYKLRAIIARIGLTGNTVEEAVDWVAWYDGSGKLLTGDNRYTMTWTKVPQVVKPGFWSVTMYDGITSYTVPNSINRFFLGSDTKGLKYNKDGSVTMYIQADNPGPEMESNWLPAPKGAFQVVLRAYAPADIMIRGLADPAVFPPPPAVPVK
jgi:hypothetical protein